MSKGLPSLDRIRQVSGTLDHDMRSRIMRMKRLEIWLFTGLLALCIGATWAGSSYADDWPQWLGPKRDGIWRETGILDKFPEGGPKVLWRAKIAAGYAGPAVASGRGYVTDRVLAEGVKNPEEKMPAKPKTPIPGTERVLCLSEKDGTLHWKHEYDCPYKISYPLGPRTTPTVADGKVYTLGAMGNLLCLDAEKGKV